eukprot:8505190-Pyramimonas_sp.AAC.1
MRRYNKRAEVEEDGRWMDGALLADADALCTNAAQSLELELELEELLDLLELLLLPPRSEAPSAGGAAAPATGGPGASAAAAAAAASSSPDSSGGISESGITLSAGGSMALSRASKIAPANGESRGGTYRPWPLLR